MPWEAGGSGPECVLALGAITCVEIFVVWWFLRLCVQVCGHGRTHRRSTGKVGGDWSNLRHGEEGRQ